MTTPLSRYSAWLCEWPRSLIHHCITLLVSLYHEICLKWRVIIRVLKILGLAIPIYILQCFLKIFHNSFFNREACAPQAPLKITYAYAAGRLYYLTEYVNNYMNAGCTLSSYIIAVAIAYLLHVSLNESSNAIQLTMYAQLHSSTDLG